MKSAAVLAAAAAATAAVILVAVLVGRGGGASPPAPPTVAATLTPPVHYFGDHVRARISVALDPRRVDPRSVTIEASFAPYATTAGTRIVRGPASARLDATLVCLARACVTKGTERPLAFRPALVRYRDRSGGPHSFQALWPPLLAASRLTPADVRRRQIRVADAPLPVSTAVDPTVVGWAFVAGAAALLVAAGGALARRLRARAAAGEWAQSGQPALLTALADVERLADESDGARRSAIDRLARELDRAGIARLAPAARALAWSSRVPSAEPMQGLSADVQKAVDAA